MMVLKSRTIAVCLVVGGVAGVSAQPAPTPVGTSARTAVAPLTPAPSEQLDLARCVTLALKNSHRIKAAESSIDIARARHGQALSSRYPDIWARLAATRLDDDPNFIFPASTIAVPASVIETPPMVVTLPANAFGPGFPPANVPLPVPGSTIPIPAQTFQVPEQHVTLMDRTMLTGSLSAVYALYTGGLASSRVAQAKAGIEVARQERRQTDAEVVYDVTRTYYGLVLARTLRTVAQETLVRMEATLDLTESLYKTGSGRVKKTDYLRHKAMVDTIRSMVAEFEAQEQTARAALATVVEWDSPNDIDVADRDLPGSTDPVAIESLVERAQATSPPIAQVQAGLLALKADVRAAKAGHLPRVGLFANVNLVGNSYDAGIVTPDNKTMWSVGVGVDVPVFQGFRVTGAVREAQASQKKLEQQLVSLRSGVSLEITRTGIAITKALAQQQSTRAAFQAATENRELNVRAYQDDLVETKDVIESQLMEALLAAQHYRVLYDLADARAKLNLLVGQAAPARR
jgi:outer membrane protein